MISASAFTILSSSPFATSTIIVVTTQFTHIVVSCYVNVSQPVLLIKLKVVNYIFIVSIRIMQ